MKFNKELFRKDVKIKRMITDEVSMSVASKQIGISKATLSRAERGNEVTIGVFVKLITWMSISPYKYIN